MKFFFGCLEPATLLMNSHCIMSKKIGIVRRRSSEVKKKSIFEKPVLLPWLNGINTQLHITNDGEVTGSNLEGKNKLANQSVTVVAAPSAGSEGSNREV